MKKFLCLVRTFVRNIEPTVVRFALYKGSFFCRPEGRGTEMYKKVLMGILGLAVSLMFTSGAMAQEKAPAVAAVPSQEMKVEKSNGVIDMEKKDVVVENQEEKLSLSEGDKTKLLRRKK